MSTAIVIFVKTPSLSPVKTRLAAGIGKEAALAFYQLSLRCVQETVRSTDVIPYWAVGEQDGLTDPLWQNFTALWTGEGDLGERQHHIYETLLQKHDRVLLIGADAPQLSKNILEQAVVALDTSDFVIGPARDGGYYLFGGRVPTEQKIWASVPWSTSMTREKLEAALPGKPAYLPFLTDVDTEYDLALMRTEMPDHPTQSQKNILKRVTFFQKSANVKI